MMNYDMMSGIGGGGMMALAWVTYLLVIILVALGIAALWKYVSNK